jgi:hypothetical protein
MAKGDINGWINAHMLVAGILTLLTVVFGLGIAPIAVLQYAVCSLGYQGMRRSNRKGWRVTFLIGSILFLPIGVLGIVGIVKLPSLKDDARELAEQARQRKMAGAESAEL